MKKKIAALLTAALVMTMSTATVFAAVSPNWDNANGTVDSSITATGVTGTVTAATKTLDSTEETAAKAKLSEVVAGISNVSSATVQAVVELTGTVNTGETATVTVKISNITAGDAIIVLHKLSNGTWKQETATVDNATGNVTISGLTEFSPFVFVKYTVQNTTTPSTTPTTTPSYYDDDDDVEVKSPKTGVVIPVAAMTAGICLAGAAVCGKKVKFN